MPVQVSSLVWHDHKCTAVSANVEFNCVVVYTEVDVRQNSSFIIWSHHTKGGNHVISIYESDDELAVIMPP